MKKEILNWKYGQIDKVEPQSIPVGSLSKSTNFITLGDKMELARGSRFLGTEINGGKVLGLKKMKKPDGTEIIYRKRGRKLEVWEGTTWTEVGTDLFPATAENDEMTIVDYTSLAGYQAFISSQNSSIYKIMLANPTSYSDMASTDYKGFLFASRSRLFLTRRKDNSGGKDDTGIYLSFIDEANYTSVTTENIGTGNGVLVTFADTLAFKAGGAKRTCFGITATDGTETFKDNFDGTLTGTLGGTGTINYTTGAISVTFNTAPAGSQAITADYQWEDSTNGGPADFTYTSPTREAGEGNVFRQDDGGKAMAVDSYEDIEYCFHENKTWALQITLDDTNALNDPYRKNVGIPNWQARCATGDGIYYVDVSQDKDPKIRVMTIDSSSDRIIPRKISENIDLSDYIFDKSWMLEWGDYILTGCRTKSSTENNTIILYNRVWKSYDFRTAYSTFADVYDGGVIIGDALSGSVYELFSGFDELGQQVSGQLTTNLWDLDIANLKKSKSFIVEGHIQSGQIIGVYANLDRTSDVLVGYIKGNGEYVDTTDSVTVGSKMVGTQQVGGDETEVAFHYIREFSFRYGKFKEVEITLKPDQDGDDIGFGYFSMTRISFDDLRIKQEKEAKRYRRERNA